MQTWKQEFFIDQLRGVVMATNDLTICEPIDISVYFPKNITCIECRKTFVFSPGEQGFFQSRGLSNEPKRCPHCRVLMRMRREGKPTDTVTDTNCIVCGERTTVPFLPRDEKKILCAACYKEKGFRRETRSSGTYGPAQQNTPMSQ
jgi:CxxC-x17-CxxC domain-containing protein